MNIKNITFTVFAKDRPGIIKSLSDTVLSHQGNWLESQFTRLCGRFVGIAKVSVSDEQLDSFVDQMICLAGQGITVNLHNNVIVNDRSDSKKVTIDVEANDRSGIVDEIASTLAAKSINIESLSTECESASMAGYGLFKASITVALPASVSEDALESILEGVSDDLMVSISS